MSARTTARFEVALAVVVTLFLGAGRSEAQVTIDAMTELFADPVAMGFGGWASVAIDGDIAVVGNGGAFIFERGPDGWAQTAAVTDFMGTTVFTVPVAVQGETIIVGAPSDPTVAPGAGAVYVIQRVAGVWTIVEQLLASDPDTGELFGKSVSIDGEWLLVGAPGDNEAALAAGAAYVFSTNDWTEQQKLMGSAAETCDNFGQTVSIRNGWAVMGMPSRGAYAFTLEAGTWQEVQLFTGPPPPTGFGWSVAVDGPTIVVGDGRGLPPLLAGRALVYEFDGVEWTETEIMSSDPKADAGFGIPLAARGGQILVGEGRDVVGMWSGRVTLFRKVAGTWNEVAYLQPSDLAPFNAFGTALAMDDAGHLFVGAAGDDTAGPDAGSAYLFYAGDGFRRGDANGDESIDVSDPVFLLSALFTGGPASECDDAADANDDGEIDISDAISILVTLFVPGTPPLPVPFAVCGYDPTQDSLDCADPLPCL